jgi:tetratricopeptide (TPR) repeat protein
MNKKLIILGIIVLIIILVGVFLYYKPNDKVSEVVNNVVENVTGNTTTDITKHYTVTSGDEKFKAKFIEFQDKLEEAVKAYKDGGEKPSPDFFVEKAKYAQYLGHSDWAKEILNDVFTYYDNSSVAWNNLAKLYEEEKNYVKANEYYQKMIDTFGEANYWGYYYYTCTNLMYMNDKVKTQECYDKYKRFGGSDSQIEEYLK